MKVLVFSDIHANKFGLEAVLEAGKGAQVVICLGDIVGYGAHPNECCEMLRARKVVCLAGNHDAAALGKLDTRYFNPIAREAIEWTAAHLSPSNKEWLGTLLSQAQWPGQGLQAVHASLRQPLEEYIKSVSVAQATMELMQQAVCLYGHTHEADAYTAPVGQTDAIQRQAFPDGGLLELKSETRYLVNPGSCGQPRDGNPLAKFVTIEPVKKLVRFSGVDYDYFSACAAIIDAGLPPMLGDRLFVGR